MPRKSTAPTASSNGKAASPAPSEPALTEEKLKEIEAEIKSEAAQQKAEKQPTKQAVKPATEGNLKGIDEFVQTVPTVQELATSKSFTESLDEFFESRTGRLIQTIGTVFILSLPAYFYGYADGALRTIKESRPITPASEVVPTPQATATPAVPVAPAK